mmetsp:Transcript_22853/g.73856  ORF Transcript_22853/g.73856 Transcript_22853/m.73856 type:complete len:108 (-) Transcript_22853:306-629(-)
MKLSELGWSSCAFVTCGHWDLQTMVVEQCAVSGQHVPERFRQWVNIKELSLSLEGHHHSGLDDSRNIARILAALLRRGATLDASAVSSSAHPSGAGAKGARTHCSAR